MRILKAKPVPSVSVEIDKQNIFEHDANVTIDYTIKREINPIVVKLIRDELIDFITKKIDIKYTSDELALAIEQLSMVYLLSKIKESKVSNETVNLITRLINILDN